MRNTIQSLIILLIACASLLGTARAQDGGEPSDRYCPHERASNVDARVEESGSHSECGIAIRLFGIWIQIFGGDCMQYRDTYPAHQECQGEPNQGSRCSFDKMVKVKREECACGIYTIAAGSTVITFPGCKCESPGVTIGEFEDFKTAPCDGF